MGDIKPETAALVAEDIQKIWRQNQTVPDGVERCIHHLFAEQAQARPDAPAICAWDGELTYGELDALSTKLAGHLVELGVEAEDVVPLCFEKSMWTVVAMMAVLKAGGAFVPLDPDHPRNRHEDIFRQTGAQLMLASTQFSTLWVSSGRQVVTVGEASTSQLPTVVDAANPSVKPGNAAYIIFTSGSTGVPKGVVLEHSAVATSCLSHGRAFGMTQYARVLQFASYTFDACIAEIITTLVYGGCICVPSESDRRNDLAKVIATMDVNWAFLTPSVARLLDPNLVPSLKILIIGGEQVNSADWDRWLSSVQTINGYGPTECCVFCVGYASRCGFKSGIIGTSIASVSWVVDPENHDRLAPLGSIGELLVEGPILARGYLNDADKTAAAFINDPAWLLEGCGGHSGRRGRLYKTGDLVRYDSDGNLVCLGRKDGQVKVRGQRVELGEIEYRLRQCLPEAKQLAVEVVVPPDQKDKTMLAAFVQLDDYAQVQRPEGEVAGDDLTAQVVFLPGVKEELGERLPEYMVPIVFFAVQTFPTMASGKTDRKRLHEMSATLTAQQLAEMRTASEGAKRPPSTGAERAMQQLWAQVLNIAADSIGLDDSFFRLGGDSIAAMKLVGEARKTGVQLSVANIFRYPRLADLAGLQIVQCSDTAEVPVFSLLGDKVDAAQVREEVATTCNVDASIVEDVYPCSPLQEGLMSMTAKRAGDYTMQSVLKLRADVDENVFRAAWGHVVRLTAALRTRIVQHSELGLLQVVVAEDIQWAESAELEKHLKENKTASMGLGDPLAHYVLVKEACSGKRWFAWTIHHAIYDGWSLPRILHAVKQVYDGTVLERQPSFNAFIQYLSQQDPEAAAVYWRTALADCEAASFPPLPSTVTQPVADTTVEYQCLPLPQATSDTTTSTLIRAAWALVISRHTSTDDVVFGTTVTGRHAPIAGIEAMVGPTIATVPVRVRVQKDQPVSAFLQVLQKQATEMIAYEQTGLQRIAKMGPDARHACGFQTLLVVQPADNGLAGDSALGEWRGCSELRGFTTYALMVQCTLAAEGVGITASFDERIIERWLVEKMLGQLSFVMQQLAAAEHETTTTITTTTVGSIDTLTPEDRQQLWEWNKEVPAAIERCVHDLFAEQAQARPDAPAICAWDGELTYGELDALSTKLAGHLVELGVKPESLIPLCFEKSMWTVVAMLAVLKAGGAFVPLDPDHPASRHEEIMKQTGATVLLASSQYKNLWRVPARSLVEVSEANIIQLPVETDTMRPRIASSNAAYIIFTSGSTGKPKGVVLEHRAVSLSCLEHGRVFRFAARTRALQFATYTFDACITEIFTTLMFGGCVCVPSEDSRRNHLPEAINSMSVNWAYFTATLARIVNPSSVRTLKTMVIGAERVTLADCKPWKDTVEVINGYGPTECAIFCAGYVGMEGFKSGVLGKPIASVSWIVDQYDHNKLASIGSVGELVVEGPILARGYLNDAEKTDAAFIEDPTWLLEGSAECHGRRGRMYKTGDLVYYRSDGNLVYVGRKDDQVKVRGQRVELGEIEHHLQECMPEAKQIAVEVILPVGGKNNAVLAAFLQLDDEARRGPSANGSGEFHPLARVVFLKEVEDKMLGWLPGHMVPAVYFTVAQLPMTMSGKTDRKRLREIGSSFSLQQLAELRTASESTKRAPATEAERTMQQLWAQVLNIEADSIGLDDSFFRLGGDSITAMQISSSARAFHLSVSTGDILKRKTIALIVRGISLSTSALPRPAWRDPVNIPFDLTPIQHLYLTLDPSGRSPFAQCFFLELRDRVQIQPLSTALAALVQRHSMLRARFCREAGRKWRQYISEHDGSSLPVKHMRTCNAVEVAEAMRQTRGSLDIERGPVLAAVLCDAGERQSLFVAIHHLTVDLVSWRVLLEELEDLLLGRTLPPASSTPFQAWNTAQAGYIVRHVQPSVAAQEELDPNRLSYWGLSPGDVLSSCAVSEEFVLDSRTTSALLESCNDAFSTRPLELMVGALAYSFATVFSDRKTPAIFNEIHGRETWDSSMDLTRTVGWFTSMCPVQAANGAGRGLLDAIRETKDCMRSFQDNGWSYFASQFASESAANAFASLFPVEIIFNYQGLYQQLERNDSLFKNLPMPDGCEPALAAACPRFALFDISVVVERGCAKVSFTSDRRARHQDRIKEWIRQYMTTLIDMSVLLTDRRPEWTLSDLPLAFSTYTDLDRFRHDTLSGLGIRPEDVEDVFPCSPMQEGILTGQGKDPDAYWVCLIWEAMPNQETSISLARLQQAWKDVVRRHSLLRTLLADNVPGSTGTTNVVLKNPKPSISVFRIPEGAATVKLFRSHYSPAAQKQTCRLQHHLSICQAGDEKIYLCLDINHAIMDGHSRGILLHDFQKAYDARLDPHSALFRDFILYTNQQSQEEAGRYWAEYLDGVEPCHFPSQGESNDAKDTFGTVQVPGIDASAIHAFCQVWEITPATVIQTAWALVLSRHTNSATPCFGNLSSGRDLPIDNVNDIFGPLIAMLACRVHLHEQLTVLEALRAVQRDYACSLTYQIFPLASMHSLLGLGTSALFNTALSLQRIDDTGLRSASGMILKMEESLSLTEYNIMISAGYSKDAVEIGMTFRAGCMDLVQATRLAGSFSQAIKAVTAEPNSRIHTLDILTCDERQKIWAWNADVPPAVERCVHDLFAEQARARPDAPAICAWDGELTYGELDALSTKLAGHLVELGVEAEDVVPLCFEKSMWMVVAMLAVLKAGGAFVPLDPDHPAGRHEDIFRQTGARLVLASSQHTMLFKNKDLTVVTVNKNSYILLPDENRAAHPFVRPNNAAYVIFTSGSTGVPKGVVMEHISFATSCLGHGKAFQLAYGVRVLQFAAYTFDVSIAEIFTTLLHHGSVCIPSDYDRRNDLVSAMNDLCVNWASLTPSVARLLDPRKLPLLKRLGLGGEQVTPVDWERWAHVPQRMNTYGPTECCIHCTAHPGSESFRSGTIGKSIASVSWVVDTADYNRLAPLGSIGELLVEGPILARSYLKDVEKTKKSFLDDPVWLIQGHEKHPGRRGRLYKTGDLVYYNADGNLLYVGRKDNQVKMHGQRVELGEVEHHLRECMPEIQQLAVEVVLPGGGEKDNATLAAFLQLDDEAQGGPSANGSGESDSLAGVVFLREVEEKMLERLPSHMVPTVYFTAQLPMTVSGKTDRKRLREIGASFSVQQLAELRTASEGAKRAPSTEAERTMQQLWAQVLSIAADSIGLDDSFFRLGGDSIAAMKLVGEARRHGVQLSVADLFRHPRLDLLASVAVSSTHGSLTTIPRVDHQGPVEQSFAQGRLWFLEHLYPGLTWYLMPFAARIRGPLQLAALNSALLAVEHRHETLRTTFATIDGTSVQDVKPFRSRDAKVIDVPGNDEQRLASVVQQDHTQPFDLRTEPGWRVSIYRVDQHDHVLSIVMHHIVSDGWSVDVLMRELGANYSVAVRGQDPLSQVKPLPIQYRDFSVWQRQQAQVDEHDRQLEYWVAQLQTSRPAELLCDKPRPATLSGSANVRTLKVDGSLYVRLREFCNARGVTLFVVLLAAFRATHFRLTGQEDATIGTANANRDRSELTDMIGFFVNMQCLRITVEGETFEELVRQVQAVAVASLANQDVPFERIVSKLKKDRDLSRHPLVQLVFAVHSQQDLGKLTLEGVEIEGLGDTTTSRFDLEFHFVQESDGLRGDVIFSTDLYAPETIDNMLSLFRNVLEACLKEPEAAVASMALLTEADYAQLDGMGLIRVEETGYPRQSSIVDVFRQQAFSHPSRIAVKDVLAEMTYARLDAASDVLAQWLRRRSLAPEILVGVFASRSCQTIVAFLGILKANLAYLPFDVKIPVGRMEAILSSLPGQDQRLVFVGADEQPPDVKLRNVQFVRIAEALDEQVNEESGLQESEAATAGPSATSLAYVIFTSGSTGQPKGVMVEHRGIVRLVRDNNLVQHLPTSRIMAHMSSLAFDASTWEIYACLLNGGTLICVDAQTVLNADNVLQIYRQNGVSMALLPPSLLRQYIEKTPLIIDLLRLLCVGGEALYLSDFIATKQFLKGKIVNCYGPTENTCISTTFVLHKREQFANGVPIGRALSNSGAYVMDSELRLVPLGVVGELVVTGDGLARGYTDPKRDIGRFVLVTIAGQTARAYRTGDYARHRPTDGQLEYSGRMDGQVKIRGQRVELGEIEHVLRSHKCVSDAVTVLQRHEGDEVRLAGFVTVDEGAAAVDEQPDDGDGNGGGDKDESQHVGTWEEQFDNNIYTPVSNVQKKRIGRDFIGWTSMYDGSEIDKAEMNEWLDDTINTMLNGGKPGSVLEIGSGTGMILFNLGDGLQSYVGLDPSRKAVEFVAEAAQTMPAMAGKIRLHKATAEDVGRLEQPVAAELVVLNSVVQYFPSQEYLFKVIEELLKVAGVQAIFFGDIRSYALHREFLAARALHVAGDKATKADIRRIVTDMERVEAELLVDPAFFTAISDRLPELVEHAEILPKKMKATNELSCYRYAAVIHVKSRSGPKREIQVVKEDEWIDFSERKLDRQSLQQQLRSLSSLPTIAVSNIPYSKTIVSRCLVELLDDMDADAPDVPGWLTSVYQRAKHQSSLSATDLVELAQESGCRVEISWNRQYSQRGGLDAIFHRYPPRNGEHRRLFRFPTDHTHRPLYGLSSRPLRQQFLKKTQQQLLEMLEAQLPAYMVPQAITVLDAMPVTQSGKVDRKALEQRIRAERSSIVPVQQSLSEAERTIQQLWAQVLNIAADSIGLNDSFFRLGGDSITAMQLSASARKLHIHLSTRDIFQRKTIAELVRYATSSTPLDVARLAEDPLDTLFGLSPIQELYLRLESTGRAAFDQCLFLELRTQVALESLCTALETLVQRHSMLRARFQKASGGGWQQFISKSTDTSFTVRHVRSHDLDEIVEAIRQSRSSLDIESGPVLSAVLFDKNMHQTLFIAVHHLVIDLVSWRVLLEELEDLLCDRTLSSICSISFPSWHAVQAEYTARQQSLDTANAKISPSMWSYWGVQPDALSRRDTAVEQFVLDSRTTTALLGSCNDTFRTRPLELMIAALIHSFTTVFPDRDPPTVFNETHGRHPWDDSIDVTRTVGWFTSIFPVQAPNTNGDLFNAIRGTKDCIRSFKHNGRSYFASQFVNKDTIEKFVSIFPVEMLFNYQGMYQQLERDQSLFKSMPIPDGCNPASRTEAPQFSMFNISASILKGRAHVEIMYSGISRHQEQVRNWVRQYERTLIEIPDMLRGKSPAWTLSDFPLTFHSYKDLDYFQYNTLRRLGLELDDIEDVYPCSSMQEGILVSQSKDPETYWVFFIFEVTSTKATRVDCSRLQQAWRAVVRRHSLLRTLLVDSIPGTSGTTNVVLKDPVPSIAFVQAAGDAANSELFSTRYNPITQAGNLQHHFCVCQSSDQRVYIRLDINHAIADAHSRDLVLRDLQTAYEADLDPKGPPFRNVISYLLQQSQEEAKHYWMKYLDGAEPCYFPSMAEDEVVGHRSEMVQVPGLDMDVIQAFCKMWEVTPATVIQTAWALVLSRYTGFTTSCFGNLSSGRDAPIDDINDMFGPLINMQICWVHLYERLTVIEALRLMQSDSVNAMAYQTLSLARVHNALQLGTTPLFNTVLSIQSVGNGRRGRAPEVVFHARGGADETEYDVVVSVGYSDTSLDVNVKCRTSCMSHMQVRSLADSLSKAITLITAQSESSIHSLMITADADRQQLWEWNKEVPAAVERCVHDLFAEQAQARPDAPAICAWDGELTYGELDALSTKLAGHLVELGVKAEDVVPLCFEKSMWMVVAMLAVLKAGGAFVPLDPDHPAGRHEDIFRQTAATVVLTSPRYSTLWESSARNIVTVDDVSTKMLSGQILTRSKTTEPSNAAYVIFTSGSTGQPKGVVLEHRAVSTSCLGHGKALRFTSQTRALQFASYTFDACITEIVTTLVFGGCVCVPSEDDRRDGLASVIDSLSVNWALLTPSVARLLNPRVVPTLKVLVIGGEQVLSSDWETWASSVETVNAYGPAECCVCCTVYKGVQGFKSGAIGKSVASASWVVVSDNHNQLAPLGSIGELLVEGPLLARGYLNDAEKTSAAFISDPDWLLEGGAGHPGRHGRLYKTGDLVRYDTDGNLVYVGRKDSQVKVRGQRVELGEVEHHLRACMPEAKRVAVEVILPTGEEANATLAAFLQLGDGPQGTPSTNGPDSTELLAQVLFPRDVEEKMLGRLPGHMVPTVYFAVAELPMTSSGKTDRKRLREIGASFSAQQLAELRTASEGAKRAPSTEAERTMQQLWAHVLGIASDSIGLDDSFFRLGGDSIAAMKLVGEAHRHGFRLSSAQVFRHPTLAHMSLAGVASLDSSPQSVAPFSLLPPTIKDGILCQSVLLESSIQQQDVADILPTTHLQRAFINQGIESPREAFNYFFFDIGPELDAQLLRDSCRRLLDRFPILRSQFISFREKLWQVVLLRPQLPFSTFEINGSLSEATRRICLEDIDKTDPLGLPTSFMLVRNKSIGHHLTIRLSHAQYDGVCIPVILRTLAALYMQESPPIAPSFPDYLAHARSQREASACYWRELLEGSHITRATARLRPKVGEEPALHNIKVERVIAAPQLPHNITMASLLSSAWALVLSSITGEEDVVYGHTVAGRNSDIPGIAEIVGPCLNVVPVRVRIQSAETPADLIRSVHEQFVSLGEADLAQLDEIIHDCTDWPAGSKFDTTVQHQNIDEHPEVCFAGETTKLQWFDNPSGMARQLYFLSHPQADQLKLTVGGNTHILTVEAAHSILDVFAATVAELSRNIDGPLISCRFSFPLCISTC